LLKILSNNTPEAISKETNQQKIFIKINGTGNKKIFSSSNNFKNKYHPNKIKINDDALIDAQHTIQITEETNTVVLIWNDIIDDCIHMFDGCSDINEIDLSQFDSSHVKQMYNMFSGCTSLISINFANFDTSKVTYMGYMFYKCSSLVSLDLSSFNTSILRSMRYMFEGCSALTSLNLSNFDISTN
jgi:surface protein